MEDKLDKILESLQEIKNSNEYVILIFFCFVSSCTTCNYTKQLVEEQHKTNIYLKLDYNSKQNDSLYNYLEPKPYIKKFKDE